ncbi:MAG TPA: hypothetical protein VM940_00560 [Chthoniobacterales bacterium]|jgi:hypothetical protein|nr:hypothetical protein [Chthoniobacterales bacterium]
MRHVVFPLLALLACLATRSHANPSPSPQAIAFLRLRIHANTAELLDATITPGHLKPGPEHAGDRLVLQVRSVVGELLWQSTLEDPRVQVLETSGDEHGRRDRKVVEHASREIRTRVPFFEEGQEIRVLRLSPGKADTPVHEKLLGTFRVRK